jgi:copper resistance protein C
MLPTMMRHLPVRRPGALLLAVGLSLFGVAATATAHAELVTPTPADGATVEGTPPEISGVYSEAMTADASSLKLVDTSGKVIATGGVVPGDPTKMAIDPVPELAPGTYTVASTTTSAADGDIDRKKWTFTVTAAATPEPSPTLAATPAPSASVPPASATAAPTTAPPSAAPTPAPSAEGGTTTGSGGDVLLPILAAVVILVVIGGFLYSRRDRSTPSQP